VVAYADTSFPISLYGRDANSEPAQEIARTLRVPLAFTPLLRHEARNAVRLALFRKEISRDECRRVNDAIEADSMTGALAEIPVAWAEVYAEAEALSAGARKRRAAAHALTLRRASAPGTPFSRERHSRA
jgi:hypothetical protein